MTAATITPNPVKESLTVKRANRVVETTDYGAFSRRVLAAYARRVAAGDVDALGGLLNLADELSDHIGQAVAGLRDAGYSWGEIASRVGMTRQAAQQRWGGQNL